MSTETALQGSLYALAGVYGVLSVWCVWRFSQLTMLTPRTAPCRLTSQKWIHILAAVACVTRVVFFSSLPSHTSEYYFVQMSGKTPFSSPLLFVGDSLPALCLALLLAVLAHVWALSYHQFVQTVPWYRAIVFRGGAVYFVVLAGLQVGIWVAYDQLDDGQEATLALMESTMYALTFLIVACMVVIYGRRAAFVSSGSVAGLSMRQRTKWRILVQVIVATIALTTRALVNLVACVASGLDWTGEPEASILGIVSTCVVFVLLEVVPLVVILRANRKIVGTSLLPSPCECVSRVACALCGCSRCRRRPGSADLRKPTSRGTPLLIHTSNSMAPLATSNPLLVQVPTQGSMGPTTALLSGASTTGGGSGSNAHVSDPERVLLSELSAGGNNSSGSGYGALADGDESDATPAVLNRGHSVSSVARSVRQALVHTFGGSGVATALNIDETGHQLVSPSSSSSAAHSRRQSEAPAGAGTATATVSAAGFYSATSADSPGSGGGVTTPRFTPAATAAAVSSGEPLTPPASGGQRLGDGALPRSESEHLLR